VSSYKTDAGGQMPDAQFFLHKPDFSLILPEGQNDLLHSKMLFFMKI